MNFGIIIECSLKIVWYVLCKKKKRIAYSIGHNKENTVNRAYCPILTNHNLAISDAVLIGYDKSRKAKQCWQRSREV